MADYNAKLKKADQAKVIKALYDAHGVVSLVAQKFNVTGRTVRNYANRYPKVKLAMVESKQEFDDTILDLAHTRLRKALADGERWAVLYVLNTRGEGKSSSDMTINVNITD